MQGTEKHRHLYIYIFSCIYSLTQDVAQCSYGQQDILTIQDKRHYMPGQDSKGSFEEMECLR